MTTALDAAPASEVVVFSIGELIEEEEERVTHVNIAMNFANHCHCSSSTISHITIHRLYLTKLPYQL